MFGTSSWRRAVWSLLHVDRQAEVHVLGLDQDGLAVDLGVGVVQLGRGSERLDHREADQVGEGDLAAAAAGQVVVDHDPVVDQQLGRDRAYRRRGRYGQAGLHVRHRAGGGAAQPYLGRARRSLSLAGGVAVETGCRTWLLLARRVGRLGLARVRGGLAGGRRRGRLLRRRLRGRAPWPRRRGSAAWCRGCWSRGSCHRGPRHRGARPVGAAAGCSLRALRAGSSPRALRAGCSPRAPPSIGSGR